MTHTEAFVSIDYTNGGRKVNRYPLAVADQLIAAALKRPDVARITVEPVTDDTDGE